MLFELADAVLCAGGPVHTLVGLSLVPEHRRGHGALYDGLNAGRIDIARLAWSLRPRPALSVVSLLASRQAGYLGPGGGY